MSYTVIGDFKEGEGEQKGREKRLTRDQKEFLGNAFACQDSERGIQKKSRYQSS